MSIWALTYACEDLVNPPQSPQGNHSSGKPGNLSGILYRSRGNVREMTKYQERSGEYRGKFAVMETCLECQLTSFSGARPLKYKTTVLHLMSDDTRFMHALMCIK